MPLPKVTADESEKDWMKRCMGHDTMMEDFPNNDQRVAVCMSQWRAAHKADEQGIEHKSIQMKVGDKGQFEALIVKLNAVDLDGDITLPGAFSEGKDVLISSYMHGSWRGELPVGRATIKEVGDEVIAKGQFNLDTASGRDHYEAVKFSGDLQEWSYGFKALEWEIKEVDGKDIRFLKAVEAYEISPVLKGAGVGTATLAIKSIATYADEVETVLVAVEALSDRTKSLADLRRKEGRTISQANIDRMHEMTARMRKVMDDMEAMLDAAQPKGKAALLALLRTQSKLLEV